MASKKKFVTINEQKYSVKEFDFNLVCDLEDMGISLEEMEGKPMSLVRAYAGLCIGSGKDVAGKELEQHIIKGGNFDELLSVIGYEMENSGFFQSLNKE